MAAVTCTCKMFRGSPLTMMVVDRAVGEFGLVVMSLEGVVMTLFDLAYNVFRILELEREDTFTFK